MIVELDITEEQLNRLLELTQHDPESQAAYWQLRGYWLTGGDSLDNEFVSSN